MEIILPIASTDDTGRLVRRFGYRQQRNETEAACPSVVYEDTTPLPAGNYAFAPFNAGNRWREVKFTPRDGSDPRYNGRRYYAVLPDTLP